MRKRAREPERRNPVKEHIVYKRTHSILKYTTDKERKSLNDDLYKRKHSV